MTPRETLKILIIDGEEIPVSKAAIRYSLTRQALRKRAKVAGWANRHETTSDDPVLTTPLHVSDRSPAVTLDGVEMKIHQIAQKFNCSENTVSNRIRQYGRNLNTAHMALKSKGGRKTDWCEEEDDMEIEKGEEEDVVFSSGRRPKDLRLVPGPTRWEYEVRGLVPPC